VAIEPRGKVCPVQVDCASGSALIKPPDEMPLVTGGAKNKTDLWYGNKGAEPAADVDKITVTVTDGAITSALATVWGVKQIPLDSRHR
jgi:hypothetical protein